VSESSSQDRTEKPTPRRLREARKKGQIPRSRELTTGLVVAASVLALSGAGPDMASQALQLMRDMLQIDPAILAEPTRMPAIFATRMAEAFRIVLVVMGATLVAALAAPALIGGFNFSSDALMPQFSRLNPLAGIKRMVSVSGLVELLKSLLKFGLIGTVAVIYIRRHLPTLEGLSLMNLQQAVIDFGVLAVGMLLWTTGALAVIAAIDAPYQLWNHYRQLRMTKQEIKDEYKQSEGRPEVKGRIRRLQYEMSRRAMMDAVPTADVIVTNPTHYAVALKYTMGEMKAPKVVAKGSGELAALIREKAKESRVPLVSAPPLARALYRNVKIDREIPAQLYQAVAQVLTYIYQLRHWRQGQPWPQLGSFDDVPGGEPDPD